MKTTREQEIDNAKYAFHDSVFEEQSYLHPTDYFKAGAKWADENPKSPWINVKQDLPCNHSKLISLDKSSENMTVTEYVVASVYGYKVLTRMYELNGKWYWETDEPTHWFAIPEPPTEQLKIIHFEN